MGDRKNFKGANNTIMVKNADGKIVDNIAGTQHPVKNVVVIASFTHSSLYESDNSDDDLEFSDAELLDAYDKAVTDREWLARFSAAEESKDPKELNEMARDEDEDVRAAVAANPYTLSETLEELALDEADFVRAAVAGNSNTFPATRRTLVSDESRPVADVAARYIVATNPLMASMMETMPADLLDEMAHSKNRRVRQRVARNPSTAPETLAYLSTSKHLQTHASVAANKNTPPEVLEVMSRGSSAYIVAMNPSTSAETLTRMAGDRITHLNQLAWINLNSLGRAFKNFEY
jgi:predicted glutamine amidotransferase